MAFAEDLTEFLDTDEFAVNATQSTKSMTVVFTDEYEGIFDVEGVHPVIVVRDVDLAASPATINGSLVTIGGVVYRVQEIQPDGTGMSTLLLEEAA